jgi:cell division septation protein DedD
MWAEKQGDEIVEVFKDEGRPGDDPNRPDFKRMIDMIRNGTARVEVRALDAPPGTPAVTTTATTTATAPAASRPVATSASAAVDTPPAAGGASATPPPSVSSIVEPLFVQVGAFAERVNASKLVERLRVNGFVNAFVVTDDGRGALHRVRIGPLRGAPEFDEVRARLRSLGFGESQLVTAR